MSVPYDRPTSEPGGCDCHECGIIFVGAEEHTLCAICLRVKQAAEAERARIVAWLEDQAKAADESYLAIRALFYRKTRDAISRGDHLKGEGDG